MAKTKHPLKSQSMIASYLVIATGLLRLFGYIGPTENVQLTIDSMDKPVQTVPIEEKAPDLLLIAAGALGIKGRRDAKGPIGKLLGGD